MLISLANLLAYTDKLAASWNLLQSSCSSVATGVVAGTVQDRMSKLQTLVLGLDDFEQESDLLPSTNTVIANATSDNMSKQLQSAMLSLINHIGSRGKEVASSIQDLLTFLTYYNGGLGSALFSGMVVPDFLTFFNSVFSTQAALTPACCMSPGIHPNLNATYTHGMGTIDHAATYTAGAAVNNTVYSEVNGLVEITTTFVGGSGNPTVTVTGTDHTGATGQTWTAAFGTNNPAAAVSTTITPAVVAGTKLSVACGSSTGIIVGSVLGVNVGAPDQEYVIVEAVADSTHFTAAFRVNHTAGAAVTGNNSLALTPGVSGRRIRSVSGLAITGSSWSAGVARVIGIQDRQAA
jgi:hypothetical protein